MHDVFAFARRNAVQNSIYESSMYWPPGTTEQQIKRSKLLGANPQLNCPVNERITFGLMNAVNADHLHAEISSDQSDREPPGWSCWVPHRSDATDVRRCGEWAAASARLGAR